MNLRLENKPVLVMASTSGIGYAVALEFAKEKANVTGQSLLVDGGMVQAY